MSETATESPPREVFEGVWRPNHCPRGRSDCKSMSQIISAGHQSFMCCGENDGSNREPEQDKYRVCFKNSIIDEMTDYDKRDLIQTAAVLLNAVSIIEEHDSDAYHINQTTTPAQEG